MNYKFYFLVWLWPLFIFGSPIEPKITCGDYIIINLGENCSARGALEAVKIKQESYPFDSCIVPFKALISCLEDNFHSYTNPDYFTMYFDNQSPINKYGIVLAHNFPLIVIGKKDNSEDLLVIDPKWRDVLPVVDAKYERRIKRFRAACSGQKKVCFFRYLDIDYHGAKNLSELLHSLYPSLEFLLICVQNSSYGINHTNWDLPRVKNYTLNTQAQSPIEEWMRIFKTTIE